jgi:hypothetical protein
VARLGLSHAERQCAAQRTRRTGGRRRIHRGGHDSARSVRPVKHDDGCPPVAAVLNHGGAACKALSGETWRSPPA